MVEKFNEDYRNLVLQLRTPSTVDSPREEINSNPDDEDCIMDRVSKHQDKFGSIYIRDEDNPYYHEYEVVVESD